MGEERGSAAQGETEEGCEGAKEGRIEGIVCLTLRSIFKIYIKKSIYE